jgi:hypothetical protein
MKKGSVYGFLSLIVALLIGLPVLVSADTVQSQFFLGAVNQGSDNSAEYLINGATSTGATTLDVGDRLRGLFDVNTIENLSVPSPTHNLGTGSTNNEWAGLFDITVIAKFNPGTTTPCTPATTGGRCDFLFGPTASFETTLATPGAMIALYEDINHEFTRTGADGTQEALIANVTDGTLRWVLGFGEDADEIWFGAACPEDVAVAGATPPPGNACAINIQQSILRNFFTVDFGQVGATIPGVGGNGLIDVNASGNVVGTGGVQTPFDVFDNFDFVFRPIPEPSSILLFGVGLLGVGIVLRRRIQK